MFPSVKKLEVPSYSQLKNLNNPLDSSGLTSLAMALACLHVPRKHPSKRFADELADCYKEKRLESFERYNVEKVTEDYGCDARFIHPANFLEVKDWLVQENPVIAYRPFTISGHAFCIVGFNEEGFVVYDPYYGELIPNFDTRYYDNSRTGKYPTYSYSLIYNLCCSEGQGFEVHFLSKQN
ncbi:C39 family peptidase [Phormidesmis sp. 146-35]